MLKTSLFVVASCILGTITVGAHPYIRCSSVQETSTAMDVFQPPPWPEEYRDANTGLIMSHKSDAGVFSNFWKSPYDPADPGIFWQWLGSTDNSSIPGTEELDVTLPVNQPYWMDGGEGAGGEARMTWLGHATVLAEVDGVNILTDPMFSARASPVQFLGPARYRPAACRVADLPSLSAVVISHTHYDHLDLTSVVDIVASQPSVRWFVPSGLKAWMVDNTGVAADNVVEMVWWEEASIAGTGVKVVFTPSNHWSKRTLSGMNKVLWGSWAVVGSNTKFWFGGDTAYCEAFKQIGDKYGPFTMAAIPIGAYEPKWFMKYSHINPLEALQIHKEIGSQCSLGIHWGTFQLTYEHYLAPRDELRKLVAGNDMGETKFVAVDIGDSVSPCVTYVV